MAFAITPLCFAVMIPAITSDPILPFPADKPHILEVIVYFAILGMVLRVSLDTLLPFLLMYHKPLEAVFIAILLIILVINDNFFVYPADMLPTIWILSRICSCFYRAIYGS